MMTRAISVALVAVFSLFLSSLSQTAQHNKKGGQHMGVKMKDTPTQEQAELPPHHDVPVQTPPPGLTDKMNEMKAEAWKIIKKSKSCREPERCFQLGALELFRVMRPEFGPANAWLFNERSAMLDRLAEALQLSPEEARELIDEKMYEGAISHLEQLLRLAADLKFETHVRTSNRRELMWSPAPGFALAIVDPTSKVWWRPPYAGTPAGPDVEPQLMPHRVTLFVYPPYPGEASQRMITREQPGVPVFFTGNLIGFILQEPQSHDLNPEKILEKIIEKLPSVGLVFKPPGRAREILQAVLCNRLKRVQILNGILTISLSDKPPQHVHGLPGCAVIWSVSDGSIVNHYLVFLTK